MTVFKTVIVEYQAKQNYADVQRHITRCLNLHRD